MYGINYGFGNSYNANGGIYNNMNIYPQPQPIGNIMNISGYGYNNYPGIMGGYYNPYVQGYYNPYLIHKQQQALEAQIREQQRQQSDIWKKLSRNVNTVLQTVENIDEHVKKYDPVDTYSEEYLEAIKYNKLMNLKPLNTEEIINSNIQRINNQIQQTKKEFPDDMSLMDFFDKAGELLLEIRLEEMKKKQRDVSQLYDRNGYQSLIKSYAGNSNYFNTVFNNKPRKEITIDDLEVNLPNSISNEFYEKKRAFLESIFGK